MTKSRWKLTSGKREIFWLMSRSKWDGTWQKEFKIQTFRWIFRRSDDAKNENFNNAKFFDDRNKSWSAKNIFHDRLKIGIEKISLWNECRRGIHEQINEISWRWISGGKEDNKQPRNSTTKFLLATTRLAVLKDVFEVFVNVENIL